MANLEVDNTILKNFALCQTRGWARYGLGLTTAADDAPWLVAGTATHECLAMYAKGAAWTNALATFDFVYAPYSRDHVEPRLDDASMTTYERARYAIYTHANLRAILERYFMVRPRSALPWTFVPEYVEVPFRVPLVDGIDFVGRIDAVVRDAYGALWVVDHKTTGDLSPYKMKRYRMDSQMSGYVWAAEQTIGERIRGVYINGIEFAKLPTSTRPCPTHPGQRYNECSVEHARFEIFPFDRTDEAIATWKKNATRLALWYRQIMADAPSIEYANAVVPSEGLFNADVTCTRCEFMEWCDAGRPASATFEHRPWSPLR